jgi:HYR domain
VKRFNKKGHHMTKLSIRLGIAAIAVVAVVYGCSKDGGSPAGPDAFPHSAITVQSECGEANYLAMLSPVLASWQDSIETWLGDTELLDDTPAWTDNSAVGDYLGALVPALQQWEGAINGTLGSTVIDTVAAFDPSTSSHQDYLSGLSSLLVAWKDSLETRRGTEFLPAPPIFQPDEMPPVISCIADTTIACAGEDGAVVEFQVGATDDCDPSPRVTCDPPSGTTFPVGQTLVTCTAVDSSGNTSTCMFTVSVEAAQPPTVVGAHASPNVLWPPNHKWVDVSIAVETEGSCDSKLTCTILDVTSNEPINGVGDGNTEPDWMVTGDSTLKLRAERAGTGSGRVYTVHFRCDDDFGNSTEGTVEVTVPHDQGGKAAGR